MIYAQARWAGVRTALRPWLRRVALGLVLALAATASGSGDPLTLLKMLAAGTAWSVLPLLSAGIWGLPLQTALVAGILLLLRPMLQPARWLELERSLPLAPGSLLRTDALLSLCALSPLLMLQTAGWVSLARADLLLVWLPGTAAGLAFGLLAMRARRWPQPPLPKRPPATQRAPHIYLTRVSPTIALLVLPLWRDPLRASARAMFGLALVLAFLPVLLLIPLPPTLVAMGWVACAWLGLQRVNAALDAEAPGLLAALPPLPLHLPTWQRRLRLLALLPWAAALPFVLVALTFAGAHLRAGVAIALALLLSVLGLWSALTRWSHDDAHAVRLLLGLALLLALASEVFV